MGRIHKWTYFSNKKLYRTKVTKFLLFKRNGTIKVFTPKNSVEYFPPLKIKFSKRVAKVWYAAGPLLSFIGGMFFNAWWYWAKYVPS